MGKALLKSQKGVALFAAVMMLILCSGLGLLAFHVSTTEMLISNYGGAELSTAYLAESGVEAVIGWLSDPASSPDRPKFESLAASGCSRNRDETDFSAKDDLLNDVESGPFSELKEMGKIVDLRLYKSSKTGGFCTVESRAKNGSGAVKIVVV
ncbi:MAG TPA: hypothetical protein VI382_00910, partial [Candidatus Manganitrophaceae bacterium]|nr:hypothetical protein [Candidatus Manganitrophaceae bacterium]